MITGIQGNTPAILIIDDWQILEHKIIIEAYTHKEQFLALTWDTGNGAPKAGNE